MSESIPSRGDGLSGAPEIVSVKPPEKMASNKIQCDACPVLCQISAGRLGACDRWGNDDGVLKRMDPVLIMRRPGAEWERVTRWMRPNRAGTVR